MCSMLTKFCTQKKLNILILYKLFRNSKLDPKFQIWADLVPRFKYNLIFLEFGIQSKQNAQFFNILFGVDDLDPNFGPTIKVVNNFMKFGTKNK